MCVKTDVEADEMIWNCGLVYSIDREKPHYLITFSFAVRIHSEYSDEMFISGEMAITSGFGYTKWKMIVFP